MKILVTGATGFLAQHLCRFLVNKGFEVHGTYRNKSALQHNTQIHYHLLELTDVSLVEALLHSVKPEIIIHAAAMSKPDECNNNQDACIKNNVEVTKYFVDASKLLNAHFIYISTDFIFGENGPHSENDLPDPLNFYGTSKLMAEKLIKSSSIHYTIVRPVFIYGPTWIGMRSGFIQWVAEQLNAGTRIKVVNDQYRTPTYAEDICNGIEQIIRLEKTGDFHLAGSEIYTPFQMAVKVAQLLGLDDTLIEEVNSTSFPEPVRRAKKSGLKIDKANRELKYNPLSFEEGVRKSFLIQ
jgi:dTDP-4-dehydrorhamnose reductase